MVHIPAHIVAQILSQAAMLKLSLARQHDLNVFQLLALILVGSTDGVSIKEVRHKLSIPGSSLTFTIDSLEKKKLIKRQRSKEDRRQWLLSLSTKGEQLYTQILKAEREALSPALEKLSDTEQAMFLKITEEIVKAGIGD
jgi:DNA-binding MarR family transcriptional regulator